LGKSWFWHDNLDLWLNSRSRNLWLDLDMGSINLDKWLSSLSLRFNILLELAVEKTVNINLSRFVHVFLSLLAKDNKVISPRKLKLGVLLQLGQSKIGHVSVDKVLAVFIHALFISQNTLKGMIGGAIFLVHILNKLIIQV